MKRLIIALLLTTCALAQMPDNPTGPAAPTAAGLNAVTGASTLTTPGALTKVGATAGTVAESGLAVTAGGEIVAKNVGSLYQTGLLAEYRFDEGSGASLTDYSGNGNSATLVGTPTWTGGGISFGQNKRATVPLNVADVQTVQIWVDGPNTDTPNYPTLGGSTDAAGLSLWGAVAPSTGILSPVIYWDGVDSTKGWNRPYPAKPTCYTYVIQNAAEQIYMDESEIIYTTVHNSATQNTAGTFLLAGTGRNLSAFYLPTNLKMYYALFYSGVVPAASVASNCQIIEDVLIRRGVAFPSPDKTSGNTVSTNQILFNGDSETTGMTLSSVTTQDTYDRFMYAEGGSTAAQWIVRDPILFTPSFRPLAAKNVAVVWLGTNDWYFATGGITPATVLGYISQICTARRKEGYKVIVVTMLSRTGTVNGVTGDAFKNAYNALIRASWTYFADGLADVGAHANLGCDGCYSNTDYFNVDGIHLSAGGNTIVYGMLGAAVDALGGRAPAQRDYTFACKANIIGGTLTNIVVASNAATATCTAGGCGAINGQTMYVIGASDADLNKAYTVVSSGATDTTVTFTTADVADATITDAGMSFQGCLLNGASSTLGITNAVAISPVLFSLPAGSKVIGTTVTWPAAWTGPGTLTGSVGGDAGSADTFYTAASNLMAATSWLDTASYKSNVHGAADNVILVLTADSAFGDGTLPTLKLNGSVTVSVTW